eukprot:SAG11_NODE_8197_length_1048_cov_1.362487_1_plen_87_part_00
MAVASGGLAPARCPGFIASLRAPRLVVLGTGQGTTQNETMGRFASLRPGRHCGGCSAVRARVRGTREELGVDRMEDVEWMGGGGRR